VTEEHWIDTLHARLPAFAAIPALCVSAQTGWHLGRIGALVRAVEQALDVRMQTSRLNQVLRAAVAAQSPPTVAGREPRVLYASQIGTRPPAVAVFTTHPHDMKASYIRYLQGRLAAAFRIRGCPINLEFRPTRRTPSTGSRRPRRRRA
jgi:GTP-binding protein